MKSKDLFPDNVSILPKDKDDKVIDVFVFVGINYHKHKISLPISSISQINLIGKLSGYCSIYSFQLEKQLGDYMEVVFDIAIPYDHKLIQSLEKEHGFHCFGIDAKV